MNCIVVDDEPLAILGMESHIKNMPLLNLLGSYNNPLDAHEVLLKHNIDVMFLDINMPEISGLDFVKTLVNPPLIIFATAYPQYAVDSFELNVVDYLLKPIRFERFVKAVNKASSYLELLNSKDIENILIDSITNDFIFIKADRKFFKITFKDILYIEGLKDYVIIHTKDRKVITAMNLKTIMDKLPSNIFARISKSYIVNTLHIISCDTFTVYLDATELTIGISFKDEFYQKFIENNILKR
jgi:DNA-binding LytR/AlgR family response regulator